MNGCLIWFVILIAFSVAGDADNRAAALEHRVEALEPICTRTDTSCPTTNESPAPRGREVGQPS
jgi:hypothetical protein